MNKKHLCISENLQEKKIQIFRQKIDRTFQREVKNHLRETLLSGFLLGRFA